jgi:hypothetical protein
MAARKLQSKEVLMVAFYSSVFDGIDDATRLKYGEVRRKRTKTVVLGSIDISLLWEEETWLFYGADIILSFLGIHS